MKKVSNNDRKKRIVFSKNELQAYVAPKLRNKIPLQLVDVAAKQAEVSARNLEDIQIAFPLARPLACRKGCDYCCSLRVSVNFPEAYAIAHYLRSLPAYSAVMKKLQDYTAKCAGKSFVEVPTATCPLLENHACSIYHLRPNSCRRYASYSAEICHESMTKFNWSVTPPLSKIIHHVAELPHMGVNHIIAKLGLDPSIYEMTPAVLAILQDDSLPIRWLNGERILQHLIIPGSLQMDDSTVEILAKIGSEEINNTIQFIGNLEYNAAKSSDFCNRIITMIHDLEILTGEIKNECEI